MRSADDGERLTDLIDQLRLHGVEVIFSPRLNTAGVWLASNSVLILCAARSKQDQMAVCRDALVFAGQMTDSGT
jgi:hypothetical protein